MLGSVVLDVAIGMVFIFLLLSLIASAAMEILVSFVQARSANLHRGLRSLFSEESIEASMTLVDSIYNHGLIRGLYQDHAWDPSAGGSVPQPPERTIDKLGAALKRLRRWLQVHLGIAPEGGIKNVHDLLELPSYIPSRTFALALVDILNKDKANGAPVHNIVRFLTAHRAQFQNNKATEAMLALAMDARGDIKRLQTNFENWYNDSMDRASGWYRKNTQTVLLALGLLLAVAFNVNSIQVARSLWLDRDARDGMVRSAQQYISDPANAQAQAGDLSTRLKNTAQSFENVSSDLLPVGWKQSDLPAPGWRTWPWHWTWQWTLTWAQALVYFERLTGWLMTAIAISLGAPFWFDTLNKFMVVRSTVKPQEKSQPEASKD